MKVERSGKTYSDIRIPGIVATAKGTLLRYCECRRASSDWADIDIKISRSDDVGKSWNTVSIIESEGNTLNNPVMMVEGDRIVFLYCRNYRELYCSVSIDDGVSFSEPRHISLEDKADFFFSVVAVGPGHGIVHGGRLIVPIWFAANKDDPRAHAPSFISTLYSADGGENWQIGEIIFPEKLCNPSECALAVSAEGDIVISIRNENPERCRALARSRDGVSLWHSFRFEPKLTDPICMGSMTHREGRIYHSNCDSDCVRENLCIKISDDCFETIERIHVSDKGGYSDIALVGDELCVLYEKKNADNRYELHFDKMLIKP